MECRSSGLTNHQWYKEHRIYPGTFYDWVSRLRKKAYYDIPDSVSRETLIPPAVQEVVKLDLSPKTDSAPSGLLPASPIQEIPESQAPLAARIEISLGQATIHIANGTETAMLDPIRLPCSCSAENAVTASRCCSMNQMDMRFYTSVSAFPRDVIVDHERAQRHSLLPGVSWTGCSAGLISNSPKRSGMLQIQSNRQIIMRSDIKLPQPFASWSNSL